jgi:hypothetical protein
MHSTQLVLPSKVSSRRRQGAAAPRLDADNEAENKDKRIGVEISSSNGHHCQERWRENRLEAQGCTWLEFVPNLLHDMIGSW